MTQVLKWMLRNLCVVQTEANPIKNFNIDATHGIQAWKNKSENND